MPNGEIEIPTVTVAEPNPATAAAPATRKNDDPPIYADRWCAIYRGDCREILWRFADSAAVISDPPYGMNAVFNRRGRRRKTSLKGQPFYESPQRDRIAGDQEPFDPAHLLRFRHIALFGGNHFANRLPNASKWLNWDKRDGVKADNNSDFELIWTNRNGAARSFHHLYKGICRAGRENVANGPKLHEAQKPVALMKWVILQMNVPRSTVIVDPYCGSGSTLVAAKELGYRSVGIELLEKHCLTAAARVKQESLAFD